MRLLFAMMIRCLIYSTKQDKYRKEMGLEPLSEYLDYMTQEQRKTIER